MNNQIDRYHTNRKTLRIWIQRQRASLIKEKDRIESMMNTSRHTELLIEGERADIKGF